MKKIALVLAGAAIAASSMAAGAAEDRITAGSFLYDTSPERFVHPQEDKAICTKEIRHLVSVRRYLVRTKDGTQAEVPLPNYEVLTIPVDCETGERMKF